MTIIGRNGEIVRLTAAILSSFLCDFGEFYIESKLFPCIYRIDVLSRIFVTKHKTLT